MNKHQFAPNPWEGEVKNLRAWPRALSAEDLEIVTGWNCLNDKQPAVDDRCEYRVIAPKFSGETKVATWCQSLNKSAFVDDEYGTECSPPKYVFWRKL